MTRRDFLKHSATAGGMVAAAGAIAGFAQRSAALVGGRRAAVSRLLALANECAEPGWDGAGANAIDQMAVRNAAAFLRAMPEDLPLPEFAPEPDGSVSLDWMQSRHRLFSLSIGGGERLAYASLHGADKGHGVARFDGVSAPPRVLEGIWSIVNHGRALLRAA